MGLTITKHPARGTERDQHTISDAVGWVAARLYGRTDEEAEQVRAFLSGEASRVAVDEAMVAKWREHLRGRAGPFTADVGERWVDAYIARRVLDEAIAALAAALNPEADRG